MVNKLKNSVNYNISSQSRFMYKGILRVSDIIVILVVLFPICNLFNFGITDYYDELIGFVSIVYILIKGINKKLEKNDLIIIFFLFIITCIGVVSNFINQVSTNIYAIAIDALWLWKTFATFIAFKNITSSEYLGNSIRLKLLPFAKFAIWLLFLTSIVGQFIDIGVTGDSLFLQIKQFNFFWSNGIQTGWLIFCSILIISITSKSKVFYKYLLLSMIPIILTGSSLVYCWAFIEIVLLLFFRKKSTLKLWQIVFLGLGVFAIAASEFILYFTSGVRGTFIQYAVIIANRYFPLGAGFATYGSDMAQRYYSKLYIEFGWEDSWAFGTESAFLNDNFFASIIGQFGWIGFCLYLGCLYVLFRNINKTTLEKRARVTAIATVLTVCAVMIGSASAKSMMGVCTFAVLGVVAAKQNI